MMVVLDIFSKNIKITYKTTLFSKATFFVLIFGIFSIVLPYIFAYKTRGFWLKRDIFYEQPDIRFRGEYIFVASTNNLFGVISCSSIPHYEQKLKLWESCSTLKIKEIDNNFDNKIDEFNLELTVELPKRTDLTSINIIVPLEYKLHTTCPLHMKTAIIFQTFFPQKINGFLIVGALDIAQLVPLSCSRSKINNLYNYSIIKNEEDINSYQIANIITDYLKRNVSTKLTNIYTDFQVNKTPEKFKLELKIKYPEHKIIYNPDFWHILKWAWIQYFAIYAIISWITTKLKTYIFNNRLVLFYEDNPLKKKQ